MVTITTMLVNNAMSLRSQTTTLFVLLWALRLAFHVVMYSSFRPPLPPSRRTLSTVRYAPLWGSAGSTLLYVVAQTGLVAIMAIAPAYTHRIPDRVGTHLFPFSELEWAAVASFATGLVLAGGADATKIASLSSHVVAGVRTKRTRSTIFKAALFPHYSGELLMWAGICGMAAVQAFRTWEPFWHVLYVALPWLHLLASLAFFAGLYSAPFATHNTEPPQYLADAPRSRYYLANTSTFLLALPPLSSAPLAHRTRLGWAPYLYAIAAPPTPPLKSQ